MEWSSFDHGGDALGAKAVGPFVPIARNHLVEARGSHPVVGRGNKPSHWVVRMRELVVPKPPRPRGGVVERDRVHASVTFAADRDLAWHAVPNVARRVGENKVLRGRNVVAQRVLEAVPVRRVVVEAVEGLKRCVGDRRVYRDPLEHQRVVPDVMDAVVGDDGTVAVDGADHLLDGGSVGHVEYLRSRRDVEAKCRQRRRVHHEEILDVGTSVGHPPRYVTVVANHNPRRAGERCPNNRVVRARHL
mmetsp:Transcript_33993/g.89214  ORF Transcript_33993/g.89214 Transcript_33993/m.89214 type:complete len:246 (+) Transcript_33993:867-1604(+)